MYHLVSDACQINDFDHSYFVERKTYPVSDACQINDFDHEVDEPHYTYTVSDACQINDFDHSTAITSSYSMFQMPVRSMTLTTAHGSCRTACPVSDACQINDFDHHCAS